MIKSYFLFTFTLLFILANDTIAQTCLPDGIKLLNQKSIDDFAVNYPGCSTIEGDLQIGQLNSNSNITTLDGLQQIVQVNGSLIITNNPELISLNGLENLTSSITGLVIQNNGDLVNLSALEQIDSLEGKLYIKSNSSLAEISGLNNLKGGSGVFIESNNRLTSISGLNGLNGLMDSVLITAGIKTVSGLNGIPVCSEFFQLQTAFLDSLDGFNSMLSIHSLKLDIAVNLKNISGFRQLKNIDTDFNLTLLNQLTSIDGFSNLETIGGNLQFIGVTAP